MKKKRKLLELAPETIRHLAKQRAALVIGGFQEDPSGPQTHTFCPSYAA